MPKVVLLKGDGVKAGGAVPCGSVAAHMPITGCAFSSLALLDSSSAVTATDNVRFACAGKQEVRTCRHSR